MILAPISAGELIDKITILELKMSLITDNDKLKNIRVELEQLNQIFGSKLHDADSLTELKNQLYEINQELWHVEDYKRKCERDQFFGEPFVQASRKVYLKNDERAKIKREINLLTGSSIVEEKSHPTV